MMLKFNKLSMQDALLVLILLISLQACGGGTGGTGIKAYEGNVSTADQVPLKDVRLTIADTGESSITDNNGDFLLYSRAFGARVNFLVETAQFSTSISLTDISEDSSRVSVGIVLDLDSKNATLTQFSVKARITGICKRYFTNGDTIQQIKEVSSEDIAICTLEVDVFGNALPRRKIPVVLQHSSCEPDAIWITDEKAETGDGIHSGVARIDFSFSPSEINCRYRILAPFQYRGFSPISYPINTLLEKQSHENKSSGYR